MVFPDAGSWLITLRGQTGHSHATRPTDFPLVGAMSSPKRAISSPAARLRAEKKTALTNSFVLKAMRGDCEDVRSAVALGQDIDALHSDFKKSALHMAADRGDVAMVRCLISLGANVDLIQPVTRDTALHYAREPKITVALLRAGADKRKKNKDGLTPLFAALRDGATDIARLLADPPGPVPSLEATALSPNDVLVRWSFPSSPGLEIGCFELECVVTDSDPATGMPDLSGHNRNVRTAGSSTSATVTGLLSNHTYTISVRSCNIAGWSKSITTSVHLPGHAPSAPVLPVAFGRQGNDINVAWIVDDPAHVPTEYDIQVLQESSGSDTDEELNAKAMRFAAARQAKAHGRTVPSSQLPAGQVSQGEKTSSGMPKLTVSRPSPAAADGTAVTAAIPPASTVRDTGTRRKAGLRVETVDTDHDIRGLMLGMDATPKYHRPSSTRKGSSLQKSSSSGWQTTPLSAPGRRRLDSLSPDARALGHGFGYGDDVQSPFPLSAVGSGRTIGGWTSGDLPLSPKAPLAPIPSGSVSVDAAGDSTSFPQSPHVRKLTVPVTNVTPMAPPPDVVSDALAEVGLTAGDEKAVATGGQTVGTIVKDVRPGVKGKLQIRARNEFGWGPFSPVATFMLDPAPGIVAVSQTQITIRCAHSDRERLRVQKQIVARDVPDGCCEGPPWHDELWFSPWEDIPLSSHNMQGCMVRVSELLPGSRYRFRQRSRQDVDWEQCPLTLPTRTHTSRPERVPFILVTSVAPCEVIVAWKAPRCNGDWVNRYVIKWSRVRKVNSLDDSESEGDGEDAAAERVFGSVMGDITAGLTESAEDAQGDNQPQSHANMWLWKAVPHSRGVTELSMDKIGSAMLREGKEPLRSVRLGQLQSDRLFKRLPKADQLAVDSVPKRESFGARDCPLRYTIKSLRPGAYYRIGITAHNSEGWSDMVEWETPVRVAGGVPGPSAKPFAFPLTPTSLAVSWSLPRSNGLALTGFRLWRKPCVDKEESRYHDESISKHLPGSKGSSGWIPTPYLFSVRQAKKANYVQAVLPNSGTDVTTCGPPMELGEFDTHPIVASDDLGRPAYKVQTWPVDTKLDAAVARLASQCLQPKRPFVQVVVDGLAPGSFHRFKVTAVNAAGDGPVSEQGPVSRLLPSAPCPVEIVEARSCGPNSAVVCWLAPHDSGAPVLNYVVQQRKWERHSSGGYESDEDTEPPPGVESDRWEFIDALITPELGPLVFMQLPVATQLSVRDALVSLAELAGGNKPSASAGKDAIEGDVTPSAVAKAMSDSDNDLSPRPDPSQPSSGPSQHPITVNGAKIHAVIVKKVVPGWSYCYRVAAFNSEGESAAGFPAMLKRMPACPSQPAPPIALSIAPREIQVFFAAPHSNGSPITRFMLERLAIDLEPAIAALEVKYDRWEKVELPLEIARGQGFTAVRSAESDTASVHGVTSRRGSRFTGDGRDDSEIVEDEIAVLRGEAQPATWDPSVHFKGRRFTKVTLVDFLPTTRHTFRLTAINGVGASLPSDQGNVVTVQSDVPETPEITFVHVLPPAGLLLEWRVLRDNGSAVTWFDVEYRYSTYKPPTGDAEEAMIVSEWMSAGEKLSVADLSVITEQLDNIPRAWPADSVNRWARVFRGLSPHERMSFRVRAWNAVGVSGWSKPSVRILTNIRPPAPVTLPRIVRHPFIELSHVLCFRNKEAGGARVDYYHVQVKDDLEMAQQSGKGGELLFPEWTTVAFRTASEAAYDGEIAPSDDDEGISASSTKADVSGIENDNTRRLKFPCCKGALENRHCVVTLPEPPNRVWVLYRIRAHNYAGWSDWSEMRVGVGFP